MIQRHLIVEGLSCTELTIIADHAGLNCPASDKFDDAGNDAGMRKVYCLNPLMSLAQHLRRVQLGQRKVRLYFSKDSRFEAVEQEILSMRLWMHSSAAGGSATDSQSPVPIDGMR